MSAQRTVELLFFPGCPHGSAARANLDAALREVGLTPRWEEWNLDDPRVPPHLSGYGSPTVLVGGKDVTGGSAAEPGGLACRVDGAPPVERIVAALSKDGEDGDAGLSGKDSGR